MSWVRTLCTRAADHLEQLAAEQAKLLGRVRQQFLDDGFSPDEADQAIRSMSSAQYLATTGHLYLSLADVIRPKTVGPDPDDGPQPPTTQETP